MHHTGRIHIEIDTYNPEGTMRGRVWFAVVNEGTGHRQLYLEETALRQTTGLSKDERQIAVLDILINRKLPRLYKWLEKRVKDGTLAYSEGAALKIEPLEAWHIE